MEKNKLKINKLGKIGTLIPAVLAATMMNCAAATYHGTPHSASTSIGNPTTSTYQEATDKYSEENAIATMTKILNCDLNKMTGYDRLEANVQNEVVGLMADMNANTLELARLYKALEDYTVDNSGMSLEEIDKIAGTKGMVSKAPTDPVATVVHVGLQHFMHLFLDTQTLVRFRADEAEISIMDENDGHNEYLRFHTNGERDLRKETAAVLNYAEGQIINHTGFEYNVRKKDGTKASKQVKTNLDQIKALVSMDKNEFTKNHYQTLLNLINETADILYVEDGLAFGNKKMCRGLVIEYAYSNAMIQLLTVLANLGYDINNYQAGAFQESKKEIVWNASTISNITNKQAGIGLGVNATIPLKKNWDMSLGTEFDSYRGFDDFHDSIQLFGTAGVGKTTQKGNHIGVNAKVGFQYDKDGFSVPFGVDAGYTLKISDNFALDFGVGSVVNPQRNYANTMGMLGASYKIKGKDGKTKFVVRLGVNAGYTFDWAKSESRGNLTVTPQDNGSTQDNDSTQDPTTPTVYGADEVIQPGEDTTTDMGNIHDLPEQGVDLSDY